VAMVTIGPTWVLAATWVLAGAGGPAPAQDVGRPPNVVPPTPSGRVVTPQPAGGLAPGGRPEAPGGPYLPAALGTPRPAPDAPAAPPGAPAVEVLPPPKPLAMPEEAVPPAGAPDPLTPYVASGWILEDTPGPPGSPAPAPARPLSFCQRRMSCLQDCFFGYI